MFSQFRALKGCALKGCALKGCVLKGCALKGCVLWFERMAQIDPSPGLSSFNLLAAAAIVDAAASGEIVGVDERLLEEELVPLPDLAFLPFCPVE